MTDALWQRDPTRKQLRDFGISVGAVLLLVGGVLLWRHPRWNAHPYVWGVGAVLMVLGATAPMLLKRVYQPWMALAFVLGIVTTTVLLSVLYVVILPLFRLVALIGGKDSLERGWRPGAEASYWKPHDRIDVPDRHFRAF